MIEIVRPEKKICKKDNIKNTKDISLYGPTVHSGSQPHPRKKTHSVCSSLHMSQCEFLIAHEQDKSH